MKLAAIPFLMGMAVFTIQAKDLDTPSDNDLIKFVQQRTNAVRITKSPYQMEQRVAMLCRALSPEEMQVIERENLLEISNPHRNKFVHIYVSPGEETAMRTPSGIFPEGTVVLKEKFSDATGTNTEQFTGMVKREPGYNPECGDWEFFVLPGDASGISERGKIQNCMECHEEYKNDDFIAKSYMNR
jgi:Cytochrome P460